MMFLGSSIALGLQLVLLAEVSTMSNDQRNQGAPDARNEPLCFGGAPEQVGGPTIKGVSDDPSAKPLLASDGHLLRQSDGVGVQYFDLGLREWRSLADFALLKAVGEREVYIQYLSPENTADRFGQLAAVDLESRSPRAIGKALLVPFHSQLVLDGGYLYFVRSPLAGAPADYDGFFRIDLQGTVRRLGPEPSGAYTPFFVDGDYVYWSRDDVAHGAGLWRRRITGALPSQHLAVTKYAHLPMVHDDRRIYYLDGRTLASVPIDGSAPATEHFGVADPDPDAALLLEGRCIYWTTKRAIMRAKLGNSGPVAPEVVAGEGSYRGGAIAISDQYLYWLDSRNGRLVRAGRSAVVWGQEGSPSMKSLDTPPTVQNRADGLLAVGDGWGCAHVDGPAGPQWQCWRTGSTGTDPLQARTVPWLSDAEVQFGSDRVCYLNHGRPKCWPWPDFVQTTPEDLWPAERKKATEVLAGGTFACTALVATTGGLAPPLLCEGDGTYGQLAKQREPELRDGSWPWALGTWHGCVGHPLRCWGRGDGGQLGFAPNKTCQVDGRRIACSDDLRAVERDLRLRSGIRELFAGDMFTCATSEVGSFSCWGASRDGWIGDTRCSPDLRASWPIPGSSVAAPNATCVKMPTPIPAFDAVLPKPKPWNGLPVDLRGYQTDGPSLPGPRFSVGPRGACLLVEGNIRCVGAIATPVGAFTKISVGSGIRANACGVAEGHVRCWGEDYVHRAGQSGVTVEVALQ